MDAIEVKMQSPTKKRAGGVIRRPGQMAKRRATTPPRMTRSILKKFNENGGTPVELSPGLDMGVKRRGPRTTRPPKRPAQDQDITGSVKQAVTKKRKETQSQGKESKSKGLEPAKTESTESEPKEPEHIGPQPAEPQVIEPQPAEPQKTQTQPAELQPITAQTLIPETTTPQPTKSHPGDLETKISRADVAAASRLAQAAVAAGLTRTTPEPATPVVEDRPSLVRFTKTDLRDILSEVVVEDGTRQKMEPHWLARTEFLTWWERPAADMDHVKEQVRRMAARWSKDLQARSPDDSSIPTPILESWRADLVIVGDPKQDAGGSGAENEGAKAAEDRNAANSGPVRREGCKNEAGMEGEGTREAKGSDGEDQVEGADDSVRAAEALAGELTTAMREMAEWKKDFDKQISTQPEFRRRRAWTTIVMESQQEATALEEAARDLGTHKFGLTASLAEKAAQTLSSDLMHFRNKLKMDRAAFLDEFDEEGVEILLEKTGSSKTAEGQLRDNTQQGETQDTEAVLEEKFQSEPVAKYEGKFLTDSDLEGETASEPDDDVQTADIQRPQNDTRVADIEDHHDFPESETGQAERLSEAANNDSDTRSMSAGPELKPEGKPTEGPLPSDQHDEFASTMTNPPVESNFRIPDLHPWRDAQRFARENPLGLMRAGEEENFDASPVAKLQGQSQEGERAEAEEKESHPEPTPCVPEESGSQSPTRQRPGREQRASEVTMPSATVPAEGPPNPFRQARIKMAAQLYKSATIEEASSEGDHTDNQAATSSDRTDLLTPETNSAASSPRSASPEIISCKARNMDDSSSIASNISSLPDDPGSPGPGRSEAAEEVGEEDVGEEDIGDLAPDAHSVVALAEDTSFPQDMDSPVAVVSTESTEEVGGTTEETAEDISPSTHIKRLLEEASMPRDIGASIASESSRRLDQTDDKPEEIVGRNPTLKSPQGTDLTASGIPSGGNVGLKVQVEQAVEDGHAAPDAAPLPQRSSIGGDFDSPPAVSVEDSPFVVPPVRYIKPQWEDAGSLFSPEEPTCVYSANEAEEDDDEDEASSVDDKETDDVDP